jgi:fumarate reductase subunit D
MLGIRIYFSDFMRSENLYKQGQILFLMIFSVFTAEIFLVLLALYLYHGSFFLTILSADFFKFKVLIPKFIFYGMLTYFLYWILKTFQAGHALFLELKKFHEETVEEAQKHIDQLEKKQGIDE